MFEGWHEQLRLQFVVQEEHLGDGHAVYVARDHLDCPPALVIFGDTISTGDLAGLLAGVGHS